jgi:hypothetical protein
MSENVENKKEILGAEKEMIDVFTAIFDSIIKSEQAKYSELSKFLEELYSCGEDRYRSSLNLFYANLSECISKPYRDECPANVDKKLSIVIPYFYNGTFEHFVRTTIENKEGSCCSGDKTAFVLGRVKAAIKDNKNYSLYRVYTKDDEWLEDKEKIGSLAYWSPTSFADTNDAISKFCDWYFDIGKKRDYYNEFCDDGK